MKNIISVILLSLGLVISNSSLDAACRGGRCSWRRPAPRVSTPVIRRPVAQPVVPVVKKAARKVNEPVVDTTETKKS